jgi:hypothetical protein
MHCSSENVAAVAKDAAVTDARVALAARQAEPSRDRVSAAQQVTVFGRQQRFGGLRPRCPCHGGSSLPTTRSPVFGVTAYVSPFRSAKPSDSSHGMIGVPGGQPVALARRDSVNSAFDFWTVSAERLRMISLAKSSAPWRMSRSASPSTPAICSLISAGVMAARPDRPYRSQFSTRRPSIRKNSRSLSVTTVRSNASA